MYEHEGPAVIKWRHSEISSNEELECDPDDQSHHEIAKKILSTAPSPSDLFASASATVWSSDVENSCFLTVLWMNCSAGGVTVGESRHSTTNDTTVYQYSAFSLFFPATRATWLCCAFGMQCSSLPALVQPHDSREVSRYIILVTSPDSLGCRCANLEAFIAIIAGTAIRGDLQAAASPRASTTISGRPAPTYITNDGLSACRKCGS